MPVLAVECSSIVLIVVVVVVAAAVVGGAGVRTIPRWRCYYHSGRSRFLFAPPILGGCWTVGALLLLDTCKRIDRGGVLKIFYEMMRG